ncbi:LicD family-domain-containing protein [Stachybotrys elegans]|uniref:LicD family-domain-containing protein n=1 Tax=Stachybotrys elegans TaxID=80388 RepID=A0A8K0STG3_9HYPO|nr:LicD family-domain-containing protein [Stachybotrys elegans]
MRIWNLILTGAVGLISVAAGAPGTSPASVKRGVIYDGKEYPEPKHFAESEHNSHYDGRYFRKALREKDQLPILVALVQTYLATCREIGVQTWLMHGTLLGWYWGQKVMPWDLDANVAVSEADIYFMAAYYNMTVYYYQYEGMPEGRNYLLEVNPHHTHRESDDGLNSVDARWIDMESGLYIDISAVRYAINHREGEGILYDKSGHQFRDTYLYPLRDTKFEGVAAKIPFMYEAMLVSQYGSDVLTNTEWKGYTFSTDKMRWVKPDEEDDDYREFDRVDRVVQTW